MPEYIWSVSVDFAILVIAVCLLRYPIRYMCGPVWASWLWAIPIIRVALPSLPPAPTQLQYSGFSLSTSTRQLSEMTTNTAVSYAAELHVIWLLGVILSIVLSIYAYQKMVAELKRRSKSIPIPERAYALLEELKINQSIKFRHAAGTKSTFVTGFLNPTVYLPLDFEKRYSNDQQVLVLRHEICHVMRHDIWYLAAARAVRCVLWFHPFAYVLDVLIKLDLELACDETTASQLPTDSRFQYAKVLVESARGMASRSQSFRVSFVQKNQIKTRIKSLLRKRLTRPARNLIGCITFSVIALGALTESHGLSSPAPTDYYFDTEVYRNGLPERIVNQSIGHHYKLFRVTTGEPFRFTMFLDWVDYPAKTNIILTLDHIDDRGELRLGGLLQAYANNEDLFNARFAVTGKVSDFMHAKVQNEDGTESYRMKFRFYPVPQESSD